MKDLIRIVYILISAAIPIADLYWTRLQLRFLALRMPQLKGSFLSGEKPPPCSISASLYFKLDMDCLITFSRVWSLGLLMTCSGISLLEEGEEENNHISLELEWLKYGL